MPITPPRPGDQLVPLLTPSTSAGVIVPLSHRESLAPPWLVIDLHVPLTSSPSAAPCPFNSFGSVVSSFPLVPPWSSGAPLLPQSSGAKSLHHFSSVGFSFPLVPSWSSGALLLPQYSGTWAPPWPLVALGPPCHRLVPAVPWLHCGSSILQLHLGPLSPWLHRAFRPSGSTLDSQ